MCILYILFGLKFGRFIFKLGHHTGNRQGKRIVIFLGRSLSKSWRSSCLRRQASLKAGLVGMPLCTGCVISRLAKG